MHARPARPGRRAVSGQTTRSVSGQTNGSNADGDDASSSKQSSHDAPQLPRSPLAQSTTLDEENGDEHDAARAADKKTTEASVFESGNDDSEAQVGLGLSTGEQELDSRSEGTAPRAAGNEIPLEAVANALKDASRDDLILALKNAKEQMDVLDSRVEALTERNESLEQTTAEISGQLSAMEGDRSALEFALAHREERIDELMREQERLEEDVYLRTEVNERLRKQITEMDRARTDAERRYTEQTASIDRERQFYLDQEKLLQTQKSKTAAAYDRAHAAQQELARENERLQAQLSEMRANSPVRKKLPSVPSSSSMDGGDGAAQDAATDDEKEGNDANEDAESGEAYTKPTLSRNLHAETESSKELESLRAEHTALQTSHSSLTQTMMQLQTELRDVRASNADLRQQNQMFVDILQEKTINGDLVTGSAVLNRDYNDVPLSSEEVSSAETSELDDVPDSPGEGKKRRSTASKRAQRNSSGSLEATVQESLANELNGENAGEVKTPEKKSGHRHSKSASMSTDPAVLQKEIGELRDANRALTLYINKILDRIIAREGYENVLAVDSEQRRTLRAKASRMHMKPSILPSSSPEKPNALTRAGLGRGVPSTLNEEIRTPKSSTSRDWKSYLPLVGTPQTPHSVQTGDTSGFGSARRIRSSEEVEDLQDQQERERIRQAMLNEGIIPPEHQLKAQKRQSTSFGTFFARIMGTPSKEGATDGDTSTSTSGMPATPTTQHLKIPSKIPEASGDDSFSGPTSEAGSSSLSTQEMRQRALEAGDASSNLTDMPERKERRLSRRLTSRSTSLTSASASQATSPRLEKLSITTDGAGDVSRGPSEAGDESYGYIQARSPDATTPTASNVAASETAQEPGWRKALKRVSLLYPVSVPGLAAQDANNNPAGVKSPTGGLPAEP